MKAPHGWPVRLAETFACSSVSTHFESQVMAVFTLFTYTSGAEYTAATTWPD